MQIKATSRRFSIERLGRDLRGALFSVLGALAISLQVLVVQTHVDGLAGLPTIGTPIEASASFERASSFERGSAADVGGGAPLDRQKACYICQEMALSGAIVLASAPVLPIAAEFVLTNAPVRSVAAERRFAAHDWQSRAPPLHL